MVNRNLQDLSAEILKLEKIRVNKAHWADLTFKDLNLIDNLDKRQGYRKEMETFHMRIINTFSTLVPQDFKFSVPNDRLTYRIMAQDYMNYFYNKGMTREEIIEMLSNNKISNQNGEKHI